LEWRSKNVVHWHWYALAAMLGERAALTRAMNRGLKFYEVLMHGHMAHSCAQMPP
jgi:hypothetical protein